MDQQRCSCGGGWKPASLLFKMVDTRRLSLTACVVPSHISPSLSLMKSVDLPGVDYMSSIYDLSYGMNGPLPLYHPDHLIHYLMWGMQRSPFEQEGSLIPSYRKDGSD